MKDTVDISPNVPIDDLIFSSPTSFSSITHGLEKDNDLILN